MSGKSFGLAERVCAVAFLGSRAASPIYAGQITFVMNANHFSVTGPVLDIALPVSVGVRAVRFKYGNRVPVVYETEDSSPSNAVLSVDGQT